MVGPPIQSGYPYPNAVRDGTSLAGKTNTILCTQPPAVLRERLKELVLRIEGILQRVTFVGSGIHGEHNPSIISTPPSPGPAPAPSISPPSIAESIDTAHQKVSEVGAELDKIERHL